MKNQSQNPYQTNKGGQIIAPKKVKDDPRASVIRSDDLRAKRTTKGGATK